MGKTHFLLCLVPLLGACAATPMTAEQCRGTDWHALGDRDGFLYAIQPQDQIYSGQCGQHGLKIEQAQYMDGWREGYSRRSMRGGMGSGGGM